MRVFFVYRFLEIFQHTFIAGLILAAGSVKSQTPVHETFLSFYNLQANGISLVHHRFPELSGKGFSVAVKERAIDTTDIDLIGRVFLTPLSDKISSVHSNQMATLIAGQGNSSSETKGVAKDAMIYSTSFSDLGPDSIKLLKQFGVFAQNHSYGVTINNEYSLDARAYDLATYNHPEFVHVFSAGNQGLGNADGVYKSTGFATLTGSMKMAKNVLIVGGHDREFKVNPLNSKGPAFDGRLKPEVAAFGEDGTSDAAAIATGTVLLLQQAYKSKTGTMPKSSLIRATLAAGADDMDAEGIDFSSGFGALNAYRSIEIIKQSTFQEGVVNQSPISFSLAIPAETSLVKIVLCWTDPWGTNSNAPLVNDLDLELITPSRSILKPWVLSSYPHPDSLKKKPIRKRDGLNTIEMISVKNPESGTYQVVVKPTTIRLPQSFSVAYVLTSRNSFDWVFPTSSDVLSPGEECYLRWNTTFSEIAKTEISINGGDWILMSNNIDLNNRFVKVTLPQSTGKARIRLSIAGNSFVTDEFLILSTPELAVGFLCDKNWLLTWNKIPGATRYEVKALGKLNLEPYLITADTAVVIDKAIEKRKYFSVSPHFESMAGKQGLTINYQNQGVKCFYKNLNASLQTDGSALVQLQMSTLYQVSDIEIEKFQNEQWTSLGKSSPKLNFVVQDFSLTGGNNLYRAKIRVNNETPVITEVVNLLYADEQTFLLFPNPVKQGEELQLYTNGNDLTVDFFDSQGSRLQQIEVLGSLFRSTINPDLASGFYYYQFYRNGKKIASGKLLVK